MLSNDLGSIKCFIPDPSKLTGAARRALINVQMCKAMETVKIRDRDSCPRPSAVGGLVGV